MFARRPYVRLRLNAIESYCGDGGYGVNLKVNPNYNVQLKSGVDHL